MRSLYSLAHTKDKKEVVLETDPRAYSLLVGAGCEVPAHYEDDVRSFEASLVGHTTTVSPRDAYARELAAMSYKDVKEVATEKGIAVVGVKKVDLIASLVEAFEGPAGPELPEASDEEFADAVSKMNAQFAEKADEE